MMERWLALMIGNSRLHLAWFVEGTLKAAWDANHLSWPLASSLLQQVIDTAPPLVKLEIQEKLQPPELWIASVVPDQFALWQNYPHLFPLTLDCIPLKQIYPTLGIDRALGVWGALSTRGAPALVIDGGTALTLTGVDRENRLIGGAILPGIQLQLRSLSQNTAALPLIDSSRFQELPPRWGLATPEAIYSGVFYTVLAGLRSFIDDWLHQFPDSTIALTGGDSPPLYAHLCHLYPDLIPFIVVDPSLIFWGIREIRANNRLSEDPSTTAP